MCDYHAQQYLELKITGNIWCVSLQFALTFHYCVTPIGDLDTPLNLMSSPTHWFNADNAGTSLLAHYDSYWGIYSFLKRGNFWKRYLQEHVWSEIGLFFICGTLRKMLVSDGIIERCVKRDRITSQQHIFNNFVSRPAHMQCTWLLRHPIP